MKLQFGFSYVGLIFLLMLILPNVIWTRHKPQNYEKYAMRENKILLALERIGQMLVSSLSLIFSNFNIGKITPRSIFLFAAFLLMLLYEVWWIRYFCGEKTMQSFYGSLLGIPVPGAVLPVAAFLLLGIYGRNPFLIVSVVILGIGHIGIHLEHKKEIGKSFSEFETGESHGKKRNIKNSRRFGNKNL